MTPPSAHFEIEDHRRPPFTMLENRVFDQILPVIGPFAFSLFALLCRFAGARHNCYPSLATLATRTGMSLRKAQAELGKLERLRLISIERRPGSSSLFHIEDEAAWQTSASMESEPAPDERAAADHLPPPPPPPPPADPPPPVLQEDLEPPSTPSSSFNTAPSTAGFSAFWEVYPLHRARLRAERAWRHLRPSPDLAALIMKALALQIRHHDDLRRAGRWAPAWPHPATWLADGRWEDVQDPPPSSHPPPLADDPIARCARRHFFGQC